jgi:hypothetical protein
MSQSLTVRSDDPEKSRPREPDVFEEVEDDMNEDDEGEDPVETAATGAGGT